ncbi:MAG: S8 family serine peptidase [Myxococcota bacterium]
MTESPIQAAGLDKGLKRALKSRLPPEGIAIGVALRREDLPPFGSARRALVQARQQRVLDVLSAGTFRLKRRYESLSGFSGWAQRPALEALTRHPEVVHIYVDGVVRATLAQGIALVGADSAHAQGFTGSGVNVAVLDTGIDTDHPDLSDDLVAEQCFCDTHPSPRFACCPNGSAAQSGSGSAEDDAGHGTSVAGIITSGGVKASLGVAPDAGVVAVKVLNSGGGGTFSDIAAALDWVLTNRVALGIRIVNMSLGDSGEYNDPSVSPCTGTNTANAIQDLHAAGVAVFASSGNDGHDDGISFPACVAEAISVGGVYDAALGSVSWSVCTDSSTAADVFVCHSNSDEILDVLAPNWKTRTSALGGGTRNFGGTSASSPYAAGEGAILVQDDGTLTPEQIRTLLSAHGPLVTNPDNGLSFTRSDVDSALLGCSVDGDCDDGLFCNGPETCTGGICQAGAPVACSDGVSCTLDSCNEATDSCDQVADDSPCDNGLFCDGAETCDAVLDCQAGTPVACSDGVSCTADSCVEILGCVNEPIEGCATPVPTTSRQSQLLLGLLLLAAGAVLHGKQRRLSV